MQQGTIINATDDQLAMVRVRSCNPDFENDTFCVDPLDSVIVQLPPQGLFVCVLKQCRIDSTCGVVKPNHLCAITTEKIKGTHKSKWVFNCTPIPLPPNSAARIVIINRAPANFPLIFQSDDPQESCVCILGGGVATPISTHGTNGLLQIAPVNQPSSCLVPNAPPGTQCPGGPSGFIPGAPTPIVITDQTTYIVDVVCSNVPHPPFPCTVQVVSTVPHI